MIRVGKDAEIHVSEQTLRELLAAVDKAKEVIQFTDEPMPDGDMDIETFNRCKASRGQIRVYSPYGETFIVSVEKQPHSQESMGYRLDYKGKEKATA